MGDLTKLEGKYSEVKEVVSVKDPVPLWSTAPQLNFASFSPPRLIPTEVPGLQTPGEQLYETIFKLNEGQVAVAPNQPENVYYVVVVRKREPASREQFAQTAALTQRQLQMLKFRQVMQAWLEQVRREAGLDKVKLAEQSAD